MGMTTAGWLFLLFAWAFIFTLTIWCYRKVFANPDSTYEHPEKTEGPGSAPGA